MLISKSQYLSLFNVFFFSTKYFIIFGKGADQGHRGLARTKDHILYTPKGLELSDAGNTVDRVAVQFVIRQEKGTFNRSFNILQASLKIWVQHVKTIPGNLLLTVSYC